MSTKKNVTQPQKEIVHYCETKGIKLTPLRENILMILLAATQPMTAYAVLDQLKINKPKAQVMSVYRVLDYLLANGLIHRIENLNAFMPCCHLFERHVSQWLICETCGRAEECALPIFKQGIETIETQTGFSVTTPTIELMGVCHRCQHSQIEQRPANQ